MGCAFDAARGGAHGGRRRSVDEINERFTEVYRSIAENEDEVLLSYESLVGSESESLARLGRDFERDRLLGAYWVWGA